MTAPSRAEYEAATGKAATLKPNGRGLFCSRGAKGGGGGFSGHLSAPI